MVTEREEMPLNSSIFGIGLFAVYRLQGRLPTSPRAASKDVSTT